MLQPEQHHFSSQRLELTYWSWGKPERPTVIMQHGGRDHARSWDQMATALADQYYIIAPDLRGHGDSQWEKGGEYSLCQYVFDFLMLIEHLGSPVHVIAHSYGGLITYLAAGTAPYQFLSITSIEGRVSGRGIPPLTPAGMQSYRELRHTLEHRASHVYASLAAAAQRMREVNPRLSPELSSHLAHYGTRLVEGGYVWKFDNWARPGVRRDDISTEEIQSFIAAINCPVLLIMGEHSWAKRGMHDTVGLFPQGKAVIIPDAGHWVHLDAPEHVLEEVRAHINNTLEGAP